MFKLLRNILINVVIVLFPAYNFWIISHTHSKKLLTDGNSFNSIDFSESSTIFVLKPADITSIFSINSFLSSFSF